MISMDNFVDRLQPWTEGESGSQPLRRLDKTLVHKHREENVFVARIEQVESGDEDSFIVQLFLESDHAFFFEHPLDHYPGLMLVEAGRQAATALTHLFYGVPLDSMFILQGLSVDFTTFAELREPVFILSRVREKKLKQARLTGMFCEGVFIQRGKPIGSMSGRWQIFDRRAANRLRSISRVAGS